MNISRQGISLIKSFEACILTPYFDAVGVGTVGWGNTALDGKPLPKSANLRNKSIPFAEPILQSKADILFLRHLESEVISPLNGIFADSDLPQPKFDALCSLVYNIGIGNFKKSSVLSYSLKREWRKAADSFLLWNKAGGKVLAGLAERRAIESALFANGIFFERKLIIKNRIEELAK